MKKIIILVIGVFAFSLANAQDVKFKKGKVLIDGKECLDYESSSNNTEITTLDGKQTILLKFIRTGVGHNGGLYNKVVFVEQNKSFSTRSFIFTRKLLVKKLLSDDVILDCKINEDKIDKFIMKFDENIEESLIRN